MDTFRAEYSGGRITEQDCRSLLQEVNGNPLSKAAASCDHGCWFVLATFLTIAICLPLYLVLAIRNGPAGQLTGDTIGIGVGIIVGGGFPSLIFHLCYVICRKTRMVMGNSQIINAVIKKHENTTFSGKQVAIRMSPHRGYLMIQFLWTAQSAPMMMNPMAMGYGAAPIMM